ncbi:MAG: hypothetical protein IKC08_05050, partial [Lentisphaeria bacterium]|nr:hypothetical protein [Lentisphaeria bacterium]
MGKDLLPVKGKLLKKEKFSLKEGKFTISIRESSSYLLEAEVITPKGKATASQLVFVRGMDNKEKNIAEKIYTDLPLEIIRDKVSCAPGEKVRFLITSKWENGTFFLFRHPERESNMEKAVMTGKSMVVEMEITEKDYPNTFFEAVTVRDGKIYSEKMNIPVPPEKKIMDITLLPAEKTVSPGGKLPLKVLLKDSKGKPLQGVFTLAVYDRKLEQISANNAANIFSFFWGWKRQFFSRIEHLMQTCIPVHKGSYIANLSSIWSLWFLPEKTPYGFGKEKSRQEENTDTQISVPVNRRFRLTKSRSAPVAAMAMAPVRMAENMDAALSGAASGEMENSVSIRENFADSLLWIGRKNVGKDGTAEVLIPVSDDLTSWRVRVWGLTSDNKVGEAMTEFTVNKDLMCRLTLPRYLINGDESTVVAHFHNLTEKEMDIAFSLQNNTSSVILAGGKKREKLLLSSKGYKSISFPIKAMQEGEGSFTLKAWDDRSRKNDALLLKLPVLVKGSPKTLYYGGVLDQKAGTKTVYFTVPEER